MTAAASPPVADLLPTPRESEFRDCLHAFEALRSDLFRELPTLYAAERPHIAAQATAFYQQTDALMERLGMGTEDALGISAAILRHNTVKPLWSALCLLMRMAGRTTTDATVDPVQIQLRRLIAMVSPIPRELSALAGHVRIAVQADATAAHVRLEGEKLGRVVLADSVDVAAVHAIVFNLARNGIQHRRVFPSVIPHDAGSWQSRVRLGFSNDRYVLESVDNGTGMTEARRLELLSPEVATVRSAADGDGVGWASIKAACRTLGWTWEITTVPGEGSTFTFHPKPGDFIVLA